MLYAFCQRHRHVPRADAPYIFFNLLKTIHENNNSMFNFLNNFKLTQVTDASA
jgi:hypothetical protein